MNKTNYTFNSNIFEPVFSEEEKKEIIFDLFVYKKDTKDLYKGVYKYKFTSYKLFVTKISNTIVCDINLINQYLKVQHPADDKVLGYKNESYYKTELDCIYNEVSFNDLSFDEKLIYAKTR
jgi:hypothetical protein